MTKEGQAVLDKYIERRLAEGATSAEINGEVTELAKAFGAPPEKKTRRRIRGSGCVYKRGGSKFWWAQFFVLGKPVRESTGEITRSEAVKFLQRRLHEVSAGKITDADTGRQSIAKLVESALEKKRLGISDRGKSVQFDTLRWNVHLKPVFGDMAVRKLNKAVLNAYVIRRRHAKAANGTINREISVLRHAFKVAEIVPTFRWPSLPERNIRTEYLPDDKFDALAAECGAAGLWLRAMFAVAVSVGWRENELTTLKVKQFDAGERTLRLEPGTTKNDQGRVVPLADDVYPLIVACAEGKKPDDYLFTNDGHPVFRMEAGRPVITWRKTWANVCKRAGLPKLRFHDLRRTAARNNRNAGTAEEIIMKMGGWRTSSVFKRYAIVGQDDMREAVRRQAERRRELSDSYATFNEKPSAPVEAKKLQ